MKTKVWSVAVALLALVLCGTATLTYAQQNDENSGASAWAGHRHGHMEYLAKELNLTDAQKKQVADLQTEVNARLDKILTAEQKRMLRQMRPGGRGGFGPPGFHRGRGPGEGPGQPLPGGDAPPPEDRR